MTLTEDDKRELSKVEEALGLAVHYHTLTNEANATLHKSERVLYSPLTVALEDAKTIVRRFLREDE